MVSLTGTADEANLRCNRGAAVRVVRATVFRRAFMVNVVQEGW